MTGDADADGDADEEGDVGHTGGEKMVMVALRNPSKCLWTLKLLPTLERQAATLQCILGDALHAQWREVGGCKSW